MKQKLSALLLLGLLLGSYRGYVALLQPDNGSPIQVFPYPVASLPPADQDALTRGIPVKDQKHLSSLLEDYLS